MSVYFFASQNARFLLGLEGRDLFLMKDYRELWRRKITYSNFQIVGVGDNGKVVIQSDEGIIVYPLRPQEEEEIIPAFSKENRDKTSSSLGKVVIDQFGENLCIEIITLKSKITEQIFSILASTKKEKGQVEHSLLFYNFATGKQKIFYRYIVDRKVPHAFSWGISPNFSIIIWGEAQKVFKGMDTRFSVADIEKDNVFDRFDLEGLTEWNVMANNVGLSLIDSPQRKAKRTLLVSNAMGDKFKLTIPSEYAVAHLGKNFVAFESRMAPKYLFKKMDDIAFQEVDLSGLDKLHLEYQVIFSERDDINFVAWKGSQIKVVHTNPGRFATDAKRWEMMAEQHIIDTEISSRKEALERKQKSLKLKQDRLKADELMKTITNRKKEKTNKKVEDLNDKIVELDELKEMFTYNEIGKYEYVKEKMRLEREIEELRQTINEIASGCSKSGETSVVKDEQDYSDYETRMHKSERQIRKVIPIKKVSLQEELQKFVPMVMGDANETKSVEKKKDQLLEDYDYENLEYPPFEEKIEDTSSMQKERRVFFKKKRSNKSIKMENSKDIDKYIEDKSSELMDPYERGELKKADGETSDMGYKVDFDLSLDDGFLDGLKDGSFEILDLNEEISLKDLDLEGKDTTDVSSLKQDEKDNIEQAVEQELNEKIKLQIEKYEQLLEGLEESYKAGGIPEDSYKRLRKKYMKKLSNIKI